MTTQPLLHRPQGVLRVNSCAFLARAMRWTPLQQQKIIRALARKGLF